MIENTKKDEIDDLLKTDPLVEAERLTGKSYKADEETASIGFGLHLLKSKMVKDAMKSTKDTYYGMSLKDYIEVVEDLGFEKIYEEDFRYKSSYEDKERGETFFVYAKKNPLILLHFDSFGSGVKTVNSASLQCRWYGENLWDDLSGSSNGPIDMPDDFENASLPRSVRFDAREALRRTVSKISNAEGHIFNNWWNIDVDSIFSGYPDFLSSYDWTKTGSKPGGDAERDRIIAGRIEKIGDEWKEIMDVERKLTGLEVMQKEGVEIIYYDAPKP